MPPKYRVKIRFTGEADFIVTNALTTFGALDTAQRMLELRLADIPGVTLEVVGPATVKKEE